MTAIIHTLASREAPSLDPIMALTAEGMNAVNSVILERMQSKVAMIPELAGHLIAGGGKRAAAVKSRCWSKIRQSGHHFAEKGLSRT